MSSSIQSYTSREVCKAQPPTHGNFLAKIDINHPSVLNIFYRPSDEIRIINLTNLDKYMYIHKFILQNIWSQSTSQVRKVSLAKKTSFFLKLDIYLKTVTLFGLLLFELLLYWFLFTFDFFDRVFFIILMRSMRTGKQI